MKAPSNEGFRQRWQSLQAREIDSYWTSIPSALWTSMAEPPWLFLQQSLPPSVVVRSQPLLSKLPWPSLWVWVFFESLIWSRERNNEATTNPDLQPPRTQISLTQIPPFRLWWRLQAAKVSGSSGKGSRWGKPTHTELPFPLLSELPWPSLWVWVFFEFLIWSRERKKKEEQEHGLCKN